MTVAVVVTTGLVAGLAACTAGPPGPDEAARTLAAALASGDFGAVTLDGSTPAEAGAQWTAAYAGLAPLTPSVVLQDVTTHKDDKASATATLAFTWDVDAGPTDWTYTTHAKLTRVENTWHADWSTATLAPDLAPQETLGVRRIVAARADVTTADGTPIVQPREVVRIGVDKANLPAADQDAAARALATALGYSAEGVEAFAARVAAAGPKAFVEAIVVRLSDPDLAKYQETSSIRGVLLVPDTMPLAPSRRFARPVLGTVGEATAEIVEASEGAVQAGDLTGLSGLQRAYDAQLRGRPGLVVSATWSGDEAGAPGPRDLFTSEPVPGTPLVVTLVPPLQDAAEEILAGVAPASAIVAIRPSTGDVLVAASGAAGGLSTATMGAYAPGSTFKVVTSLALLRAGLTPQSTLSCPATTRVDGREFSNYPGYPADRLGEISLRTALASSCNTAFLGARDLAPQEALASAAVSLGLGGGGDLGFSAYLGTVPSSAEGTEHAASMIGQGRVEASPLGMATVAASIAAGARVTPRLVLGASPTGAAQETATTQATATPVVPLTQAEAGALREMMRAMVTEGSGDFLLDVPGAEVMAKSGTAQFGPQDDLRNHVWMIAIQGDLAVAVFVDEGDFGTTTSGPLLEQFLRAAAALPAAPAT